jgi:hypothetical protein
LVSFLPLNLFPCSNFHLRQVLHPSKAAHTIGYSQETNNQHLNINNIEKETSFEAQILGPVFLASQWRFSYLSDLELAFTAGWLKPAATNEPSLPHRRNSVSLLQHPIVHTLFPLKQLPISTALRARVSRETRDGN